MAVEILTSAHQVAGKKEGKAERKPSHSVTIYFEAALSLHKSTQNFTELSPARHMWLQFLPRRLGNTHVW